MLTACLPRCPPRISPRLTTRRGAGSNSLRPGRALPRHPGPPLRNYLPKPRLPVALSAMAASVLYAFSWNGPQSVERYDPAIAASSIVRLSSSSSRRRSHRTANRDRRSLNPPTGSATRRTRRSGRPASPRASPHPPKVREDTKTGAGLRPRGIASPAAEVFPTCPRCPGQTPTCTDAARAEYSRPGVLTSPAEACAKMLTGGRACPRGTSLSPPCGSPRPPSGNAKTAQPPLRVPLVRVFPVGISDKNKKGGRPRWERPFPGPVVRGALGPCGMWERGRLTLTSPFGAAAEFHGTDDGGRPSWLGLGTAASRFPRSIAV